jgi:hypothetical protein
MDRSFRFRKKKMAYYFSVLSAAVVCPSVLGISVYLGLPYLTVGGKKKTTTVCVPSFVFFLLILFGFWVAAATLASISVTGGLAFYTRTSFKDHKEKMIATIDQVIKFSLSLSLSHSQWIAPVINCTCRYFGKFTIAI